MKLRVAVVAGVLAGLGLGAPVGAIARSGGARRPLMLAGLQRPVRVVRDRLGVPHVYARSDHDAFFANGYVQAQDRFFQMDVAQFFSRRGGGGTPPAGGGAPQLERTPQTEGEGRTLRARPGAWGSSA